MSYTYDQRKRPQGQQSRELERTTAPGPGMEALMSGRAAPSAAQKGQSFDLDAAMKAKMENAFGDLSAVRNYTPPIRTQAPLQPGPYTGPVTHAVSNASPSPMAAGVMQARRGKKPRREKIAGSTNDAMDANYGESPDDEEWDRRKKEREKDWKYFKKNLSPGELYDLLEGQLLYAQGINGDANVPMKYQDWFWKHKMKESRWSGKKGWGTPEEGKKRKAARKAWEQAEDEKRFNSEVAGQKDKITGEIESIFI